MFRVCLKRMYNIYLSMYLFSQLEHASTMLFKSFPSLLMLVYSPSINSFCYHQTQRLSPQSSLILPEVAKFHSDIKMKTGDLYGHKTKVNST